ncbi:MAG: hypothetical protein LQ344_006014 [Seirophora lacunosa]|nr:MAG: hypothetical protein LQ344_006014 [Seirophora lacunosa]
MDVAPIVVAPSQAWDGNDGPWSTFALGFGTPPQYVRVLLSTTSPKPLLVDPLGCTATAPPNCPNRRGNQFFKNTSSTWQDKGLYTLDEELNLGYSGNGNFGLDSITLGYPGSGAVTVHHQLFASIATQDFYLGSLGIAPRATNLTKPGQKPVLFAPEDAYPSVLSVLKQERKIPSISYAYTAGARYRLKQASLTLGGSDWSRFVSSNLTFDFADDVSRDLVVGIQSITVSGSDQALLPTPILSFVDATVSQIWLPLEACKVFEKVFGLAFDEASGLYLVNETLHQSLLARNSTLVFTLGADSLSTAVVNITLPYAAFDLQLSLYPNAPNATRYFPLRRAANESQYTLGRTFLQETYLIADYERSQFSINQGRFVESLSADIRAISSPDTTNRTIGPDPNTNSSTGHVSSKLIVSILIPTLVVLSVIGVILMVLRRRKVRVSKEIELVDQPTPAVVAYNVSGEHELEDKEIPTPELHGIAMDPSEMYGGMAAVEMNAEVYDVHEMD